MDPDDVIRRSGAAEMNGLLSGAQPLVDVLWQHEARARPLSTPESKAGLKARLLAHVDSIADRGIKSLYRRELLERFSAFAYPPRGQQQIFTRTPVSQIAPGKNPILGLVEIVVTGLARFPHIVQRHASALSGIAAKHQEVAAALDTIDAGQAVVESRKSVMQITPAIAERAITMLYEMEAVHAALSKATADLAENMTDATWAEQQRLVARQSAIMRGLSLGAA
jgi:DNA primase